MRFASSSSKQHAPWQPTKGDHDRKEVPKKEELRLPKSPSVMPLAVVHVDDFTVLGSDESLGWMKSKISERFETKFRGRLAPGPDDVKSIRILNRVVQWTEVGIEYEADQRHT